MKTKIALVLFATITISFSQEKKTFKTEDLNITPLIDGTLYTPITISNETKLIILITGSGPTDRNGNQTSATNNSLKFLSEELVKNDFAVFSYDKRLFAQIKSKTLDEKLLRFYHFIDDAKDVIVHFKSQKKYNKIIVLGHSEGSLIGMVAAKDIADAYISLEGAGRPINLVLSEQLAKQAPAYIDICNTNLELLKQGKMFENKHPLLSSIFRESVQPYIISWMKFNPQDEIKKLTIPILIINGTKDLQTTEKEAYLLKEANPSATLKIIENMNHILKEIKVDSENLKSYSNPDLPVMPSLITEITNFVNKN